MWELYTTGITHRPSFVNAIAEEAYAAGLRMPTADVENSRAGIAAGAHPPGAAAPCARADG